MRGVSVIPKTAREDRLEENLRLFPLGAVQFGTINGLSDHLGAIRFLDPKEHVGFDIFDEENDQPVVS